MYSLTSTLQVPDISKKTQKNGSFQFCSMWINNYLKILGSDESWVPSLLRAPEEHKK